MAKFVLKDCDVNVNAVDLSNYCSSVTIETTSDEVDVTGFQSDFHELARGLGDATITLSVFQDFSAAAVDATLWPLSQADTPFPVIIKPSSGAVAATNPSYTMQALLFSYNPLDGSVGDASSTEVTLRNADQTGLVRAVA